MEEVTLLQRLPYYIAKNLLNLKRDIEKVNDKVPSVLCVICSLSNACYKRTDGVYVLPITALKD